MDVYSLTRALIDIDSVTPNELAIGIFLEKHLRPIAEQYDGTVERIQVEGDRYNVWATWGKPDVVLSTHMDTVPPFIPSKEDEEFIWGRGACDTHGLLAAMIKAIEALLAEGVRGIGLLIVVGEEVNGFGASFANNTPPGNRYLINGEPTENRLGVGSKGTLCLRLTTKGTAAHSAYPELGDSAIDRLLEAITRLRETEWPSDDLLGETTLNVGTIRGGTAANIIPDEAEAQVMIRVVSDLDALKDLALSRLPDGVQAEVLARTPAVHLKTLPGFETMVAKYTTDIPKLTAWGEPLLIGPGSIHFAHKRDERVPKRELAEAVGLYQQLVKGLLAS